MSILVGNDTRLIVQGITGNEGNFHARQMQAYGTNIVAGVTPGKGGQWTLDNPRIPVYDTVKEAIRNHGANASIIYVPAGFASDAIMEAADSGVDLVICITEGIPVLDMAKVKKFVDQKGVRLIGPNCPGLITPGEAKVGIMPGHIHKPGNVGLISRSGTLTYEVVQALTDLDIGQSTAIGIGGDPIIGSTFIDLLKLFESDPNTNHVVVIGEIGGTDEQKAADFIATHMSKPVTAFIAGRTAPPGKRMGHAGAIIQGGEGTAAEKIAAFREAGVKVALLPEEVAQFVKDSLHN
ncbi:MAG: succinate--CoA ligase subunit alpha [Anaerolineaceae bacterium 4572_78]|nr:MAG: succinate--CoA ligase subunit alpha [Anaerolineaceae bacterium 4572_78]